MAITAAKPCYPMIVIPNGGPHIERTYFPWDRPNEEIRVESRIYNLRNWMILPVVP